MERVGKELSEIVLRLRFPCLFEYKRLVTVLVIHCCFKPNQTKFIKSRRTNGH